MKVVIIEQFGPSSVMKLIDQPTPNPGYDEVLVRVKAASVNPVDIQTRRGDYNNSIALPARLGVDCAGIIEKVGKGVHGFQIGDEVFYVTRLLENEGSYATHHVEKATIVAKKPETISFEQAATLPLSAGTAWECLIERGRLKSGDKVLIHGGAGGVGVYAIQIAKFFGAHVVTTSGLHNKDFVEMLGADVSYDYRRESLYEELRQDYPSGFDIILDTVGQKTIENSLSLLETSGRLVSIVDMSEPQNLISGWLVNAEIHFVFTTQSAKRLAEIAKVVDAGGIKPIIERVMKLSEIVLAHDLIETGNRKGKIAISID
ncbi:zinc-binding dehydrogenase [Legionella tucsonensis]|uniref:Quinone oxidoreductase (NADPH:quinone reductase) n=1 Tax=Legionella tucsonensis TaxID=40335 RepID=A0A0W0ZXY9_9GAMM|nr:zinc-binding dehydrogenase [Legionella tucsonensis]KTD73982.1 Quinone oxidoreductase (NADPH:quinone reductase) [Legionella tucsonensis]